MNIMIYRSRIEFGGGEKIYNWISEKCLFYGITIIWGLTLYDKEAEAKKNKLGFEKVKLVDIPIHLKTRNPIKYSIEFRRILIENAVDILIIFCGSLFEQLIAQTSGIKVLFSERSSPGLRPMHSRILMKLKCLFSDATVFQTIEAQKYYNKEKSNFSRIIPNPIIDEIPDVSLSVRRNEIVTVGRLVKGKNHIDIINAFKVVHPKFPDFTLIIYGDGNLYNSLFELIKESHLENCIKIIRNERNIIQAIKDSNIFILNSIGEGMPNALIEALAVGLLSISTNCPIGGPKYLINEGSNGYLIPVNNKNALIERLLFLCENYNKLSTIRMNAMKINAKLAPEKVFAQWLELFIELSKKR
jgi:glycosyltransferase involved in cell wall biosynthesis